MQEEVTYRIGEVAELLQEKTYVLRYWEKEFPQIAPRRTKKGQRLYTEENVALIRRVRQLLHEKGMTIEGTRKILESGAIMDETAQPDSAAAADSGFMEMIRNELDAMRKLLIDGDSE